MPKPCPSAFFRESLLDEYIIFTLIGAASGALRKWIETKPNKVPCLYNLKHQHRITIQTIS